MTDWSRLVEYIEDFFPDPSYSSQDVKDWMKESVPSFKVMSESDKKEIIGDWENFILPQSKSILRRMSSGFRDRIRRFLGRFRK